MELAVVGLLGSVAAVHSSPHACSGLRTPAFAAALGIPRAWVVGLEDDFLFSNLQKTVMVVGAVSGYWLLTAPLFKKGKTQ